MMDDLAGFLSPPRDPAPDRSVTMERATVTASSATTVTVDWAGGVGYAANYGTWYAPQVGDEVLMLAGGRDLFVLGKVR